MEKDRDYSAFCQELEKLRGKMPLYKLGDDWVDQFVQKLPDCYK